MVAAFGHVSLKPALLIGDAACDLQFGRFGFIVRPCELKAAWFISDAACDLRFGRHVSARPPLREPTPQLRETTPPAAGIRAPKPPTKP